MDLPQPDRARRVSIPLIIGIVFLPIVFVWFLLRKGHSVFARAVGFGWLGVLVIIAATTDHKAPAPRTASGQSTAASDSASHATEDASSSDASSWQYSDQKDDMRGTSEHIAEIVSSNSLNFDFPYSGGSQGTIILKKGSKHGLQVLLKIEKGQFICYSFTGGHVAVKFDQGPVQNFRCESTSDGSSNYIFIEPESKFVAGLRSARHTTIETEYFKAGNQQLSFNTAGLKWP